MKIEFENHALERILTDQAYKMSLPFEVIKGARNRLIQIEASTSESDLRGHRGLRYKILKGDKNETRSIRINDKYRIFFTIAGEGANAIATVTFIGDPH